MMTETKTITDSIFLKNERRIPRKTSFRIALLENRTQHPN